MWGWFIKRFRRESQIPMIKRGDPVVIYLVPGVFRVNTISYNTDGEAVIQLLKEDRFLHRYKAQ